MATDDPAPFEADPLLGRLHTPVLGLNVAVCWPLPEAFRAAYERLRQRVLALDGGVYVYPLEQTHFTVATIVSFKRHERPDEPEAARILSILPPLSERLDAIGKRLQAFRLTFGAPLLVPAAAFLPVTNPTGEIARIREALMQGPWTQELQIPRAIHSTLLRFIRPPADPERFRREFEAIAAESALGDAVVEVILVTTETRPYMMAGRIVHQVQLKGPESA